MKIKPKITAVQSFFDLRKDNLCVKNKKPKSVTTIKPAVGFISIAKIINKENKIMYLFDFLGYLSFFTYPFQKKNKAKYCKNITGTSV